MKAVYMDPVKQKIYSNFVGYAHTSVFPHYQICESCGILIGVEKFTDLSTIFSDEKNLECPACHFFQDFTGFQKVPEDCQQLFIDMYNRKLIGKRIRPEEKKFFEDQAKRSNIIFASFIAISILISIFVLLIHSLL